MLGIRTEHRQAAPRRVQRQRRDEPRCTARGQPVPCDRSRLRPVRRILAGPQANRGLCGVQVFPADLADCRCFGAGHGPEGKRAVARNGPVGRHHVILQAFETEAPDRCRKLAAAEFGPHFEPGFGKLRWKPPEIRIVGAKFVPLGKKAPRVRPTPRAPPEGAHCIRGLGSRIETARLGGLIDDILPFDPVAALEQVEQFPHECVV